MVVELAEEKVGGGDVFVGGEPKGMEGYEVGEFRPCSNSVLVIFV